MQQPTPLAEATVEALRAQARAVSSELGGDPCAITVIADGEVVTVAVHHPDPQEHERLVAASREHSPVGTGIAGTVAATARPFVVCDVDAAQTQAAARPALAAFLDKVRSVAVLPLATADRVLGTIGVTRYHPRPAFTPADIAAIERHAEATLAVVERGMPVEGRALGRRRSARSNGDRSRIGLAMTDVLADPDHIDLFAQGEAHLRALLHASVDVIWTADPHGRFVDPQRSWESFTGQTWYEHAGAGWLDAVHAEDRAHLDERFREARRTGDRFASEARLWHEASRSHHWVELRAAPVPSDSSSEPGRWVGTVTDIDDTHRARAALAEREEQLRRLAEADVVAIVRFEGDRLVDANEAFVRLLGLTSADIETGVTLGALTPETHVQANADLVTTLASEGAAAHVETALFHRDGTTIPVQLDAIRTAREPLRWIAYVVDLSERALASRRASALLHLASALSAPTNMRELAQAVTEQLHALEADGVAFVAVEDGEARVLAARGLDALGRHGAAVAPMPAALAALASGTPSFDDDGEAWAHLPVARLGTDRAAVVSLAFATPPRFDTATESFYLGVSSVIGLASTRVLTSQQQERERVAGMLDALLDAVLLLRPVRGADGKVHALEVEHANAAAVEVIGPGAERPGTRLRDVRRDLPDSVIEQCAAVLDGGPAIVIDGLWLARPGGGRQAVAIQSLRYGDRLVLVWRDVTERERVQAELQASRRDLEAAQHLARLGSWRVDLATRRVRWSDEMHRILGVPLGALSSDIDDVLDAHFHRDDRERVRAATADLLEKGGPLLLEARVVRNDGAQREVVILAELERDAETDAPLAIRGTTQDVADQRDAERRLQHAATLLRREHEVISALQEAILPRELPRTEGLDLAARYLPAAPRGGVGGDWYDAFVLGDGRVMLVIGDVAGHGVSSAAEMGALRHALRAYALEQPDPGTVLTRLHRFAEEQTQATCLLVVVDPATGTVEAARAGHLAGLHVPHDGPPMWVPAEVGGPPLGAITGVEYVTGATNLAVGEWLLLYTDGLIERRTESIDEGLARLAEVAGSMPATSADDVCDTVLDALLRDQQRFDDVCVLALRRT